MDEIRLRAAAFVKHPPAAVAFQEGLSPLDGNQGNKKKADIMVQPLQPSRRQTTIRTRPGLIVNLNFPGLHSTNKDEDAPLLESSKFYPDPLHSSL
jgi:hypothetical protein